MNEHYFNYNSEADHGQGQNQDETSHDGQSRDNAQYGDE